MKFSFCSCLKRSRANRSTSSEKVYYTNSTLNSSVVILQPSISSSSNTSVVPIESEYEKIVDASVDKKSNIKNTDKTSIKSTKFNTSVPIKMQQQQLFDDDTELYATVNKTRVINNKKDIKTFTPNIHESTARRDLLQTSLNASSFSAISTANTHSNRFNINSQHRPQLPPPLPPLPLQVYTSTVTNSHNTIPIHNPHYDEIIVRESLQDFDRRLQTENEQLLHENYYSSVNSEQDTSTGSDLYAEITNHSASDIVYQRSPNHYYSRPSNDASITDDLSERYATVHDE